jgi:hypothetical protein
MSIVFERNDPSAAAALFDQLPAIEPRRHGRRVSIEVRQIPERRRHLRSAASDASGNHICFGAG